ncbi:MAG: phosphatase PAP2 family protein [Chlamydiota bacterium]
MFPSMHLIELQWMQALQVIRNPFLDTIMRYLNYLDSMPFYTLLIVTICFAYDQKIGFRLLFLAVLSWFINQDCKMFFKEPRPIHLEPSLGLAYASSFGFPSGAAQTFLVYLGFISLTLKKKWVWITSISLTLLVSFSRVYLGLHFPSDILGGWIVGTALLTTYWLTLPKLEPFLKKQSHLVLILLSLAMTIFLWMLALTPQIGLIAITLFGVSVGCIFTTCLKNPKHLQEKIIRSSIALIGVALIGLIRFITKDILELISPLCIFASGVWFTYGVNLLCRKLKL